MDDSSEPPESPRRSKSARVSRLRLCIFQGWESNEGNAAVAPKRQILVPLFSLTDIEAPKRKTRPEGLDEEEIEAAELTFAGEEQTGQEPREDRESGEAYVCKYCGSDTCDELVKSAFWADRGLVAVEDVPARVCRQCGERFYDERTTWKIEKVLAPAVSEPEGELPAEPPYQYIAKIEVSDLDAMVSFLGTDAGKDFVKSWSVYIDPKAIFTLGREV